MRDTLSFKIFKALPRLSKLFRLANRLEEDIICILLAVMTLLVFVEVIMRFVFNTGIMWAQELTLHLSAWMVLFGTAYGIKVGSHIGVDAVVKALPNKIHRAVSVFAVLLSLIYCGFFLKGAWVYLDMMKSIGITMEDLPVPRWIAHSILFIGFIMIAFRLLELFWGLITGKSLGFRLADEARESMYLSEQTDKEQETGGKA